MSSTISQGVEMYGSLLEDAYGAAETKHATVPTHKNMRNLKDTILSIPTSAGEVASIAITNKSAFSDVSLPTNGTYLEVVPSVTIEPADARYVLTSSDPAIAKPIYDNGNYKVRFLSPGAARIMVSDYTGSVSDYVDASAKQATTSISLSNFPAFSDKGTTWQLNASFVPASSAANGVTWSSSDDTIATVNSDGLVTFVGIGSVTITATVNGYSTVTASKTTAVVVNETDPDLDVIHTMIQAGTAEASYPKGSTFNFQYSEDGGTTVYTMPIRVAGYRRDVNVEVNGIVTPMNVMDIEPVHTTITSKRYSKAIAITNLTASSGETTAQEGYYYYTSAKVPLNYETGDTLDFSVSPTIIKTNYNVDTAAKLNALITYGDRRWEFSDAREWLNNVYKGFYSSSLSNHLGKVEVSTVDDVVVWSGAVRKTYDYWYLPSNVELLAGTVYGSYYTQNQVANEGVVLPYYVQAAGTSTPSFNSTAQNNARIKTSVKDTSTSKNYWTRSVLSSDYNYEWYVCTSGNINNYNANSTLPLAPLAVLI